MRTLPLFFCLASVYTFVSCKKVESVKNKVVISLSAAELMLNSSLASGTYDEDIALWADQSYEFLSGTNYASASTNASFYNININDLSLNGQNYSSPQGFFEYNGLSSSQISGAFGANSTFASTGGSQFNAFSQQLYVPSLFVLQPSGFTTNNGGTFVSKSSGCSIGINPDLGTPHDILVFLYEFGNAANNKKIFYPNTTNTINLGTAELVQFPINARIKVKIVRGNVTYKNVSNTEIQFRAGVLQHLTFDLTP
jgi:hypothetical protein